MASLGAPQLLGAGARCPNSTLRKQITCRPAPRAVSAVNNRVSTTGSCALHKTDLGRQAHDQQLVHLCCSWHVLSAVRLKDVKFSAMAPC
jgi:hypothetical protein